MEGMLEVSVKLGFDFLSVEAEETAGDTAPLVVIKRVSKWFGATRALWDVSLAIRTGEVLGLVGANGSGKSTLVKILSGALRPDLGGIQFANDSEHGKVAIGFVHQVLGLFEEGTVAENIFAKRQGAFFSPRIEESIARDILDELGVHFSVRLKVADLSVEEQAMVAVARALVAMSQAQRAVLVVDEVTSILRGAAAKRFMDSLARLRDRGIGIVFVSHQLDEVMDIADRIAVLRDGEVCAVLGRNEVTQESLIRLMVGSVARLGTEVQSDSRRSREAVLLVRHLRGGGVKDVSLEVSPGEIVGLTGLAGSGYDDVPYLILGSLGPRFGEVTIGDEEVKSPRDFAARGARIIPADRNRHAVILAGSVLENYFCDYKSGIARYGLSRRHRERQVAEHALGTYGIKCESIDAPITSLSGGNQQKVVLARCIDARPRLLVVHEPTQGVDIGARVDLLELLRRTVERLGMAVLYVSGDLEELWENCNRIVIVRRGRVAGEVIPAKDSIAVAHSLIY